MATATASAVPVHHAAARFFTSDAWLASLAILHGAVLFAAPWLPLIAIGVWWNSNTIAHNFLHRPFFRTRAANRTFAAYLSVLLGIPQTVWRGRHLAHHANQPWRLRITLGLAVETALIVSFWVVLALRRPAFFFTVYAPGYGLGLALCALQGHFEHARGVTSHYGSIYNLLAFNDGYHAEHHASPGLHWTALPYQTAAHVRVSRWPALLRWMDGIPNAPLEWLERMVLRSPPLQRMVLRSHYRAFRALLPPTSRVRHAVIVGGGLFPRTALILREILPDARITIVDTDARNLATARAFLGTAADGFDFVHRHYSSEHTGNCDLVVFPLCFDGDRAAAYRNPPAPAVLIHDWIWRRRGAGAVVSLAFAKRLNLVTPCAR